MTTHRFIRFVVMSFQGLPTEVFSASERTGISNIESDIMRYRALRRIRARSNTRCDILAGGHNHGSKGCAAEKVTFATAAKKVCAQKLEYTCAGILCIQYTRRACMQYRESSRSMQSRARTYIYSGPGELLRTVDVKGELNRVVRQRTVNHRFEVRSCRVR